MPPLSSCCGLLAAALLCTCRSVTSDTPQAPAIRAANSHRPTNVSSVASTVIAIPVTSANRSRESTPPPFPDRAPLGAAGPYIPLSVVGFRDAIVAVPLGARQLRPILVALHGNFDRPEWQCETWRDITKAYPFILCPRGIPRRDVPAKWDRWEYSSTDKTDHELEAGLAALRERFAEYIAPGPVLFTGFSLGAILGVGILKRHPGQYGPVVFTEGGNEGWSASTVRKIVPEDKDAGAATTLRVLFACGQADCIPKSKATSKIIERSGGETQVVSGGNVGHLYDGPVAEAIATKWGWLIAGDERWVSHDLSEP